MNYIVGLLFLFVSVYVVGRAWKAGTTGAIAWH